MRFVLKSAFWLTVAFVAIRPGIDLQPAANAALAETASIASQTFGDPCRVVDCTGLAVQAATIATKTILTTPETTDIVAPIPMPPLDRKG